MGNRSSRKRYSAYREKIRTRTRASEQAKRRQAIDPTGVSQSEQRTVAQLLWHFFHLLEGHRRSVLFALGTLTVATLLKLMPPLATKLVIDYVLIERALPAEWSRWLPLPASRFELLYWIAGGVTGLSILATLIHLTGRWVATKAVNRVQVSIRRRVFQHAVHLPIHRVFELKSGGAASLLREDAGGVAELIFSMLYNPWRALIQLTGSLLVLVWVDWRLLLGGLLLLPLVYVTHRTWINRIRPLYRDIRRQRQDVDAHTTEAFGGMRVVRTFGRERSETGRFVRGNHLMIRQQLFVWCWTRVIEVIWDVLIPVASTGLLVYGGYRVLQGELTIGDVTMFLIYLAMLLSPLATLANSASAFQNNLAGMERILDLLDEPLETSQGPSVRRLAPATSAARIGFHNVSFRYPNSQQDVLRDINLEVEAGEMIALVGRSGAGKTTLCNLVARFYDPTQGHLSLDGCDLRELKIGDYRRLLGIVEQDVFLFDGTVAENIGYAVRDASAEQIRQVAEAANAQEFIEKLEQGYDTLIGERGVRLSGGQRQRLAIARALLANPRILILDEATSNLDTESERLIQRSLESLLEGRTSFVIAHRLSTIAHADRIVVLEDGRIVEQGTHAELVAHSGRYRQMVELQMANGERLAMG